MFFTNSLTKRLFVVFGILVANITIITLLALFFLHRTETIGGITQQLDNQRIRMIHLIKMDLDFLRFETVNLNYFKTGQSKLLKDRNILLGVIRSENENIALSLHRANFMDDTDLDSLDRLLQTYDLTFQRVTQKINERGFKDFGVEGTMRVCAHELERKTADIGLVELLTLRRHEKDFLLRKEEKYIIAFDSLATALAERLQVEHKDSSAELLKEYHRNFVVLTALIFEIGNTSDDGLLGVLNGQTSQMANYLEHLTDTANLKRQTIISESATVFIIISIVLIVLSLVLTYFTSVRLARPIKKLSGTMGRFIVAEGLDEMELDNNQNSDEIRQLSQSFIKLSKKLKTQFNEILSQNKELKKLNDELDRFIYSAAHDLKSPLASLEGLLILAQREDDINEMSNYFSMMKDSVKKLNGFIGDITDYAKNKRQQLKIERIDLQTEIHEAVNSLKFLPEADRIDVQVHIRGEDFYSDRTRFEIVIKNLLSNSFRYMDKTKTRPFIRVDAEVTFDDLRLSISDNGIGIAKEHVTRIFEMFYRAVEHSKGTGIGLFLVKESVKMLRGRVSVKSILGEYTIFHLTLPNFANGQANTPETEAVEMISA